MAFGRAFQDGDPAVRTLAGLLAGLMLVCAGLVALLAKCVEPAAAQGVSTPTCRAIEFSTRADTTWYEVKCVGKKLEAVR